MPSFGPGHRTLRFVFLALGLGGLALYAGARPGAATRKAGGPPAAAEAARAADPLRLFPREPRDPEWAPAMEEWLSLSLAADLQKTVPTASGVQVECRQTTCRIAWLGDGVTDLKVRMVLRLLYRPLATTQRLPGECVVSLRERNNPRARETETVQGLQWTRARGIAEIRSGEILDRFYGSSENRKWRPDWIPPEQWPQS